MLEGILHPVGSGGSSSPAGKPTHIMHASWKPGRRNEIHKERECEMDREGGERVSEMERGEPERGRLREEHFEKETKSKLSAERG